jgi:hypothetical protein
LGASGAMSDRWTNSLHWPVRQALLSPVGSPSTARDLILPTLSAAGRLPKSAIA